MTRRRVQFVRGTYYHIYNRGAHKRSLFWDDADYMRLLLLLKKYSPMLRTSVIAYCLMPNHYHWLVRQDGEAEARLLPQRVFNAYSHSFNQRWGHTGTLFEGPFHAIAVTDDEYLRQLCRYIHANPVRHAFVKEPDLWLYSNYLEWLGERGGSLVDKAFVKEYFGKGEAYRMFVEVYVRGQAPLPRGLGDYLERLEGEN